MSACDSSSGFARRLSRGQIALVLVAKVVTPCILFQDHIEIISAVDFLREDARGVGSERMRKESQRVCSSLSPPDLSSSGLGPDLDRCGAGSSGGEGSGRGGSARKAGPARQGVSSLSSMISDGLEKLVSSFPIPPPLSLTNRFPFSVGSLGASNMEDEHKPMPCLKIAADARRQLEVVEGASRAHRFRGKVSFGGDKPGDEHVDIREIETRQEQEGYTQELMGQCSLRTTWSATCQREEGANLKKRSPARLFSPTRFSCCDCELASDEDDESGDDFRPKIKKKKQKKNMKLPLPVYYERLLAEAHVIDVRAELLMGELSKQKQFPFLEDATLVKGFLDTRLAEPLQDKDGVLWYRAYVAEVCGSEGKWKTIPKPQHVDETLHANNDSPTPTTSGSTSKNMSMNDAKKPETSTNDDDDHHHVSETDHHVSGTSSRWFHMPSASPESPLLFHESCTAYQDVLLKFSSKNYLDYLPQNYPHLHGSFSSTDSSAGSLAGAVTSTASTSLFLESRERSAVVPSRSLILEPREPESEPARTGGTRAHNKHKEDLFVVFKDLDQLEPFDSKHYIRKKRQLEAVDAARTFPIMWSDNLAGDLKSVVVDTSTGLDEMRDHWKREAATSLGLARPRVSDSPMIVPPTELTGFFEAVQIDSPLHLVILHNCRAYSCATSSLTVSLVLNAKVSAIDTHWDFFAVTYHDRKLFSNTNESTPFEPEQRGTRTSQAEPSKFALQIFANEWHGKTYSTAAGREVHFFRGTNAGKGQAEKFAQEKAKERRTETTSGDDECKQS